MTTDMSIITATNTAMFIIITIVMSTVIGIITTIMAEASK